ncbi:MAG: transposase [Ignavibacteria bacterium]|nr:transposase [Ignavibacteria bacterium]
MSEAIVYVHALWGTKHGVGYITCEAKEILLEHIRINADVKGIKVDAINSRPDHVHCLFSLPRVLSLSRAIQYMKGESSYWANQTKLFQTGFQWEEDYRALSVSEGCLDKVRAYIMEQDALHERFSYADESRMFSVLMELLCRA